MPKGKNPKKASDFAKVRGKVGKRLLAPANATNTVVKAKKVVLPGQTLSADRSARVLTSRGQTAEELFGQAAHYSGRVRTEALSGLSELLGGRAWLLALHAPRLFSALCPLCCDGEAGVRAALRAALAVLLPRLPHRVLAPFAPLLALHVSCALSHLDAGVRSDGGLLLQLLLRAAPDAAAARPAPLLAHLGAQMDSPGAGAWGAPRLGQLLSTTHALLAALASPRRGEPAPLAAGPALRRRGERSAAAREGSDDALRALALLPPRLARAAHQLAPAARDAPCSAALAAALRCCVRCDDAASALAPRARAAPAAAACASAASAAVDDVAALLSRAGAFPQAGASAAPFNAAAAQLLLRATPRGAADAGAAYVAAALGREEWGEEAKGGARTHTHPHPPPTAPAASALLLDVAAEALGVRPPCGPAPCVRASHAALQRVATALVARWDACGAHSGEQAALLPLVCDVALRSAGGGRPHHPPLLDVPAVCSVVRRLPRLLWELRAARPGASGEALSLLVALAARAPPESPLANALQAAAPALGPLWSVRGAAPGRPPRCGPLAALPPPCAASAAALVALLPRLSVPMLRAAAAHCLSSAGCGGGGGADTAAMLTQAVCAPRVGGGDDALQRGWVATMLRGCDAAGAVMEDPRVAGDGAGAVNPAPPAAAGAAGHGLTWRQRAGVVDAGCRGVDALAARGGAPCGGARPRGPLLALLLPAILAQTPAPPPRWVSLAVVVAAQQAAADVGGLPPALAHSLPALAASYLLHAAADGALSCPPLCARRCADADDPGVAPVARLLASLPDLIAPVACALAALLEDGTEVSAVRVRLVAEAVAALCDCVGEARAEGRAGLEEAVRRVTAHVDDGAVSRALDRCLARL